jgi:hypothetical protein
MNRKFEEVRLKFSKVPVPLPVIFPPPAVPSTFAIKKLSNVKSSSSILIAKPALYSRLLDSSRKPPFLSLRLP